MTTEALLRLLHLASPALPIGAFAYSQGLEPAVDAGHVRDEATAASWLFGVLEGAVATLDVPYLGRLYAAWQADDAAAVRRLGDELHASRGSAELQTEDRRLGSALARALVTLGIAEAARFEADPRATQAALMALAGVRFGIPLPALAHAFVFAWCENQTAAALRLIPLGQSAGLRLLSRAASEIPAAVARGLALPDDEIGAVTPGHAALSAWHETQYSRLFRS